MKTDFTQNPFDEDYFWWKITSWKDEVIWFLSFIAIISVIVWIILLIK